jgi:hypothetical protein
MEWKLQNAPEQWKLQGTPELTEYPNGTNPSDEDKLVGDGQNSRSDKLIGMGTLSRPGGVG